MRNDIYSFLADGFVSFIDMLIFAKGNCVATLLSISQTIFASLMSLEGIRSILSLNLLVLVIIFPTLYAFYHTGDNLFISLIVRNLQCLDMLEFLLRFLPFLVLDIFLKFFLNNSI